MTRTNYAKLEREKRARLAQFGGDPVKASLAHHRERLARAVAVKDYSGMRDAQNAIAGLEAIVNRDEVAK